MIAEYRSNFAKVPESDAHGYNVSYDINSVMHYPRHAFSKNGNETIVYKVRIIFYEITLNSSA